MSILEVVVDQVDEAVQGNCRVEVSLHLDRSTHSRHKVAPHREIRVDLDSF